MPQKPHRKRAAPKEHPLRAIIRTNLRNRRVELGLSQRELGESIGVTQQWIANIESIGGDDVPSIYQIADLTAPLKCSYHDLLVEGRFNTGISASDDMRKYQHKTR